MPREQRNMRIFASMVVRDGGRLLLVQEAKEGSRGRWNLPGGHLEFGEPLSVCARRELREETGLAQEATSLIGVYCTVLPAGIHATRFVFGTAHNGGEAAAGDEILAVRWVTLDEAAALPHEDVVGGPAFGRIIADLQKEVTYPLAVLDEDETFGAAEVKGTQE
jgi:8-oxo-dGTP diphosphatase